MLYKRVSGDEKREHIACNESSIQLVFQIGDNCCLQTKDRFADGNHTQRVTLANKHQKK